MMQLSRLQKPQAQFSERSLINYCDWAPLLVCVGPAIIWLWNRQGLAWSGLAHILDIFLVLFGLSMMCAHLFRKFAFCHRGRSVLSLALISAPTATLVSSMLLLSTFEPASAWDALHFWLATAEQLAEQILAVPIDGQSQFFWWPHRHPPFVSVRYASLASAATHLPSSAQIISVGVLSLAVFLITLAYFTVRFLHDAHNACILILTFYAIFSIPLYDNHLILYGYGEAWLSIGLLAFIFSLADAIRGRIKLNNVLLALVSCIFCASVKSTGIYYAGVAFCAYLCVLAVKADLFAMSFVWRFFLYAGIFILAVSALLLYTNEKLFTISVAGSVLSLSAQDGTEVLKNNLYAFMKNSSFGMLFLIIFLTSLKYRQSNNIRLDDALIGVYLISMSFVLIGLQLFDPYSFGHSSWGSDTGGSRFFVPLVPLAVLYVAKSLSSLFDNFSTKPVEP